MHGENALFLSNDAPKRNSSYISIRSLYLKHSQMRKLDDLAENINFVLWWIDWMLIREMKDNHIFKWQFRSHTNQRHKEI